MNFLAPSCDVLRSDQVTSTASDHKLSDVFGVFLLCLDCVFFEIAVPRFCPDSIVAAEHFLVGLRSCQSSKVDSSKYALDHLYSLFCTAVLLQITFALDRGCFSRKG
jgi:hypothetical protein